MTTCAGCRDTLSADLDAAADPTALAGARAHLAHCRECRRWYDRAVEVTRLVRTAPAEAAPELDPARLDALLDELPAPPSSSRPRWHRATRLGLAGVGLAQTVLGGRELVASGAGHPGMVLGADMSHMGHEFAAWNVALGIAFLVGAGWVRHLAGTLPVLGSFVIVLSAVSVLDLARGDADAARIGSHSLVLAGSALVVAVLLSRPPTAPDHPWRVSGVPGPDRRPAPTPSPGRPARRHLGDPTRPDPAASHRAA